MSNTDVVWAVAYYNADSELIKQKNFKQDYDGAMKFFIENKKIEREKGLFISVWHGLLNENYPIE